MQNYKKLNFKNINTIIFDLGGVIIDIDPEKTFTAFSHLTNKDIETIYNKLKDQPLWLDHETGKISDQQFREKIRETLNDSISDYEIDKAYTELLLSISQNTIDLLRYLQSRYQVFALSNTNNIHINIFNSILNRSTNANHINELFHKPYYSFEIGLRKPGKEIFDYIIDKEKLNPEKSLFLDDGLQNIETAKQIGFQTLHVKKPAEVYELLKES